MKSDKIPYIIYADIESLNKKIDGCANNQENSSTAKIVEHMPCGYLMSAIWAFDYIETKHTLYRRKDFMKKFCESLREQVKNNLEKKKTVNKRTKITSRCKSMSLLWKKNLKKVF